MSARVILASTKCNKDRKARVCRIDMSVKGATEAVGQWILLGSPAAPDDSWVCGTDVVWPILDAQFFRTKPGIDNQPFVCRHMIQAGD